MSPFDDVFFQDGGTGFDDFVGYQQRALRQERGEESGFASRGGAEIEHPQGAFPLDLAKDGGKEHGGGFLHVVGTAVEAGIEGEYGAFF